MKDNNGYEHIVTEVNPISRIFYVEGCPYGIMFNDNFEVHSNNESEVK